MTIDELEKENKAMREKLYIAVCALEWIELQSDTSTQYDYDPEVILKNIARDCKDNLDKIKEIER